MAERRRRSGSRGRGRWAGRSWEPWEDPGWEPTAPLPVTGGLRAKSRRGRIGETWWSQRFVAALEMIVDSSRLTRGRAYARRGQVISLDVHPGDVTAVVQGSRTRPYTVHLAVKLLGDAEWERAETAIASQALFLARLLSGQMPDEIEEAFTASRLSLFPSSRRDLSTTCSCPDWGNPCKHAAAAFYLLAEAFDADPFLIFAWRGRPRDRLLAELRALRDAATEPVRRGEGRRGSRRGRAHKGLAAGGNDASAGSFWEPGPGFDDLRFDPRSAGRPDALLREVAPFPPRPDVDLLALLAPAYRTIAEAARVWALGGSAGEGVASPSELGGNRTRRRRRPESR